MICALVWTINLNATSELATISWTNAKTWQTLLNASSATCLSALASSMYQPMLITGGTQMSELTMMTLSRKKSPVKAAPTTPRFASFENAAVEATYSTSGQSSGRSRRALSAEGIKFLRNYCGIFSKAISPLKNNKGPAPFSKNLIKASGSRKNCC